MAPWYCAPASSVPPSGCAGWCGGSCKPSGNSMAASTDLVRPRRGKLIAGVCAGLARRFGVSPTLVRVLFVLSFFLPGPQILIYIVLWLIMPRSDAGSIDAIPVR